MAKVTLYGPDNQPIDLARLRQPAAEAKIGTVRRIEADHPAVGIEPRRLARILRQAEDGDPTSYLELAEDMEERDLHYLGVMGTRKRSVAQLDVTVEAASDAAEDQANADLLREWINRDTLEDELFDVLDAVGKGYSVTEILWDKSERQWWPRELVYRDPRWFRFDRETGRRLMLLDAGGLETPLPPWQFIIHTHKAKSGLPIRGGLARIASWSWMFKHFAQKDWAIFVETYGQPLRLGKFHSGATDTERATLLRAVRNIAADCAAIIPDTMQIDFVRAEAAQQNSQLYEDRCDWLDQQVSKAVLGQTTTTDAISGGHAVAQEHREVQKDIERADAKQLAATLNRDLVRPLIDLNRGPQKAYPRIKIGRPEAVDIDLLSNALSRLVPLGLRVEASVIRDKMGLPDPPKDQDVELLGAQPAPEAAAPPVPGQPKPGQPLPTPGQPKPTPKPPLGRARQAQQDPPDGIETAADLLSEEWERLVGPSAAAILRAAQASESADAFLARVEQLGGTSDQVAAMREAIARAGFAAWLAGYLGVDLG